MFAAALGLDVPGANTWDTRGTCVPTMMAKANRTHSHGDSRLHHRLFGSSGSTAIGFAVRVVSGSATWEIMPVPWSNVIRFARVSTTGNARRKLLAGKGDHAHRLTTGVPAGSVETECRRTWLRSAGLQWRATCANGPMPALPRAIPTEV